jgi:hypothetical protein
MSQIKTMKKIAIFLILFLSFLQKNIIAQPTNNTPLYMMFDQQQTLITTKLYKNPEFRTSNDGFHTVIYQYAFGFIPKFVDNMKDSYTYLYGNGFLNLITLDKNNFVVLTQAQLANYNIKTHDELAEYFRLTPIKIKDQKKYFWERKVYIIEKIYGKNNTIWYHKYKVEPDILNN